MNALFKQEAGSNPARVISYGDPELGVELDTEHSEPTNRFRQSHNRYPEVKHSQIQNTFLVQNMSRHLRARIAVAAAAKQTQAPGLPGRVASRASLRGDAGAHPLASSEPDLRVLWPLTSGCISPRGLPIMSSSPQPTLPWPPTGLPLRQVRIRRAALHAVSESPTPTLYGLIALEYVVGGQTGYFIQLRDSTSAADIVVDVTHLLSTLPFDVSALHVFQKRRFNAPTFVVTDVQLEFTTCRSKSASVK
ncbi:hypothetical protein B0H13DRAFT_2430813 [Mycena leptocephala]|nr:hypothetical protein B0H13DRAFT_2430813 [Mycena leptocephala]